MSNHITPELKQCIACKQWKLATREFFYARNKTGALAAECKLCQGQRAKANYRAKAEQKKAYIAQWAKQHPDKRRKYISRHRKKKAEQRRVWLIEHPIINDGLKICARCGEKKPATTEFFHRNRKTNDGLNCYCKTCRQQYRIEHRNELIERNRIYRLNNQAKIKARRIKTRTRDTEAARRYRTLNHDKVLQSTKEWRMANADKLRENERRRRARKYNAQGSHSTQDVTRQYKSQKGKCYWCNTSVGNMFHVDHVIPLSRGGSDGPENIVISCHTCNLSKGNKLPTEWDRSTKLL